VDKRLKINLLAGEAIEGSLGDGSTSPCVEAQDAVRSKRKGNRKVRKKNEPRGKTVIVVESSALKHGLLHLRNIPFRSSTQRHKIESISRRSTAQTAGQEWARVEGGGGVG